MVKKVGKDSESGGAKRRQKDGEDAVAEMLKQQMENFKIWGDMFKDMAQKAGHSDELAEIAARHVQRVEEKAKELSPELFTGGPGAVEKQKEFYKFGMRSYSKMLQEYLVSESFLNSLRDSFDTNLSKKMEMEHARDEILKSFGMPTRKDIQDIHHNAYLMNKKLDKIKEALEKQGADR